MQIKTCRRLAIGCLLMQINGVTWLDPKMCVRQGNAARDVPRVRRQSMYEKILIAFDGSETYRPVAYRAAQRAVRAD